MIGRKAADGVFKLHLERHKQHGSAHDSDVCMHLYVYVKTHASVCVPPSFVRHYLLPGPLKISLPMRIQSRRTRSA